MRLSYKNYLFIVLSAVLCAVLVLSQAVSFSASAADSDEKTTFVLHDCDTTDGIRGLRHIDRDNFMQGNGCLYSINSPCSFTATFNAVDCNELPPFEEAYLEFWLWIDDVSNLGNDHCYFRLMNTADTENYAISYRFNEAISDINSGWNFMSFKLSNFAQVNPLKTFTYDEISGFKVQAWPRWRPIAIRIDNVCITNKSSLNEIAESEVRPKTSKPENIAFTVNRAIYGDTRTSAAKITGIILYSVGGAVLIGAAVYVAVSVLRSCKK